MQDLKTLVGRAYFEYLRLAWRRQGAATLALAGHSFRFADVDQPPHDWFAYEIRRGRWERTVLAKYASAIRPGDTVFDIGAYLGPYALLGGVQAGPRGKVFTFEPDPVARVRLEKNLAINHATNVEIVDQAVSDGPGWLTMSGDLGSSQAGTASDGDGIRVPTVGLDEFCEQRGVQPAVIKMDVEGGEERIVSDAGERTLRSARTVIVEVHEQLGVDVARIDAMFSGWGKRRELLEGERWGGFNVAYSD